jgi:hypothetical protein
MLDGLARLQVCIDLCGSGGCGMISGGLNQRVLLLASHLLRRRGQELHRFSLQLQESGWTFQVDFDSVLIQCAWRLEIASADRIERAFEVPAQSDRSATASWGRPPTL